MSKHTEFFIFREYTVETHPKLLGNTDYNIYTQCNLHCVYTKIHNENTDECTNYNVYTKWKLHCVYTQISTKIHNQNTHDWMNYTVYTNCKLHIVYIHDTTLKHAKIHSQKFTVYFQNMLSIHGVNSSHTFFLHCVLCVFENTHPIHVISCDIHSDPPWKHIILRVYT